MLQNPVSGNESFDAQPAVSQPLVCHGDGHSDITIENYRKRNDEGTGCCSTGGEIGKSHRPPDTASNTQRFFIHSLLWITPGEYTK